MKQLLVFILFTAFLSAQSDTLTLTGCIELGISNNPAIKIAAAELEKMKEKKWEATSQRLPKLSLNAGYTRMSEIPEFSFALPILPQPITIMESIPNRYNLSLRIEQPLFTGFRLSSLQKSAEHQTSAAEVSLQRIVEEEKLNILKAYWNYNKTQTIVKLIEDKLLAMEENLKNTTSFLNNGLATRNDLLRLEVQNSNLKLKLTEAKNASLIARSMFNKMIGRDIFSETNISVKTSITYSTLLSDDLSSIAGYANNRPELRVLEENINSSKNYVSSAKADYFPNVFAFGDYYYSRPNQQIFPQKNKWDDTWDVGIGLKWTFWDWGNTSSKVAQAEYQSGQLEITRNDLLEKLKIDIFSKYLAVKKAGESYGINTLSIESAEENYRIMLKKYDLHLVTSAELIDAQTILLESETNRIIALADFGIALAEYNYATGQNIVTE